MAFFKQVDSFAQALNANENADSIIKVASENGVSRNDLIVHHNLTEGNAFTGENLIKVAEDEPESPLLVAVSAYEKLASGEIDEDGAYGMISQAGLDEEDFNIVADLIEKQAEEAGVMATEDVWEKVAEAHDYLSSFGLDPVNSIEFAENFAAAPDEETQDKVASAYDGLDEEAIDKIAEAYDYLSDIEGASLADLMEEYDKEAGVKDAVVRAGRVLSGAEARDVQRSADKLKTGHLGLLNRKDQKNLGVKSFRTLNAKKNANEAVAAAKKRRNVARLGAGAGVVGAGAGVAAASTTHHKTYHRSRRG